MEVFTRWVLRHPKKILLAFLAVTCLFGASIERLTINPSLDIFIPEGHPEVVYYKHIRNVFDLFNFVIVGLVDDRDQGIYRPDSLELVKRLTEAFEDIPEVQKVVSLYEFPYIEGDEEGMTVKPLYSEISRDSGWLAALKAKVERWPLLLGNLVSLDGRATMILVRYAKGSSPELRRSVYHQILEICRGLHAPHQKAFVAGMTAIEVCISDSVRGDLRKMLPATYGIVILCLWLSFRRPMGILLPLLTVTVSSIWTTGLMALVGVPLNTVTSSLPILLTAVGTAYTIHILFNFLYNAAEIPDRKEALVRAVSQVGYAVIMAGLTTVGGFASLGVSQVMPIRYLGIFAAFGTGVALITSITMIPAILSLLMHRIEIRPRSASPRSGGRGLDGMLRGYVRQVIRHRGVVYGVCALIGALCVAGTFRIYAESDYITQFKESSYIRRSDRMINRYFNGSSIMHIIVEGDEEDYLKDPEVLEKIDKLQRFVEKLPKVGGTMSLVDYLKRMNQALHADDPKAYRVPGSRELIAQYLLLYSMSGDESDLEEVVNDDYSMGCISVSVKSGSTRHAGWMIDQIKAFNARETHLPIHITSPMVLGKVVDDLTIRGQVESIITSTIVVFALVALILRSFSGGFLAILPLLLSILMNFGILGWAGIALQAGTAIIGSVALGIGIDYAIHFLNMSRIKAAEVEGLEEAMEATAGTAGRAIVYNASAVGLGFLVLVFSSFKGDIYFGAFITLTMLTASVATLTLLPCLIYTFRPGFLLKRGKGGQAGP